ncbi:DNA-3-methyladenine glycosylase I [Parapedobacter tibetensis]|uniref:DNA-3-methyladenine glycosylase I n=1 Tax=Parapedobacter tibetensis TaxID=2972951 RepID=UPI00356B72CF
MMSSKQVINRCGWCGNDDLYMQYHDDEWGKQVKDDKTLFEFLVLESAQAGLSWITILRKRAHYERLFAGFNVEKVAAFTQDDIERLLLDPGIVRNRSKVSSTVSNARIFMEVQHEFGSFYQYLYSFMPESKPIVNTWQSYKHAPVRTTESDIISKDLKKRGVKFFGTTICYAFMQAVGMVNDHEINCAFR